MCDLTSVSQLDMAPMTRCENSIIVSWNALPQAVVSNPTLEAFKTALMGDIVITL